MRQIKNVGINGNNGFCECGCGQLTQIISKNHTQYGYIKGARYKYIKGHSSKTPNVYHEQDCGYITPCWIWDGYIDANGYAWKTGKPMYRWYYEQKYGDIPEGMEADHLCRIRSCVNPDHIEPVTRKENIVRSYKFRPRITHCKFGHEFNESNTYYDKLGRKQCRECNRRRSLAFYYTHKNYIKELRNADRDRQTEGQ